MTENLLETIQMGCEATAVAYVEDLSQYCSAM
jgi:hypothetical protein